MGGWFHVSINGAGYGYMITETQWSFVREVGDVAFIGAE